MIGLGFFTSVTVLTDKEHKYQKSTECSSVLCQVKDRTVGGPWSYGCHGHYPKFTPSLTHTDGTDVYEKQFTFCEDVAFLMGWPSCLKC